MTRARIFLLFTLAQILTLCALIVLSTRESRLHTRSVLPAGRELVGRLHLTDFSLWTEARYTRHPSQADFFSPFQDFPSSLEHFPAGSVIAPPAVGMKSP